MTIGRVTGFVCHPSSSHAYAFVFTDTVISEQAHKGPPNLACTFRVNSQPHHAGSD